ncbi:hypothetical protein DERF_004511 [Dermatophagoides farinae]|uniref:Uncharacterized protein n=1 Tax=Dermatophagoides farinae TaxID=6954 RepID=A0A922L5L3_DERFA|nr:hypothetical protein DERF_004511 [Dermatophagoides farinae]
MKEFGINRLRSILFLPSPIDSANGILYMKTREQQKKQQYLERKRKFFIMKINGFLPLLFTISNNVVGGGGKCFKQQQQ